MESQEYEITKEDKAFIAAGENDGDKALRETIVLRAIEINGAVEIAQPGMSVSYISREHYVRIVNITDYAPNMQATLEQALNWDALGRGKGGLAGTAVRAHLRHLFQDKRECIMVTKFDVKYLPLMKEYSEYSANNKHFYATWNANAWNVLGLATSSFIRECHHWNAQNTRPIKALCGSLNMEQELPESEYRKAFYLAIHPVPLIYLTAAYMKSKDPKDPDLSETVKQRLNVPPAGYADFCACGVAAQAFLTEKYAAYSSLLLDIKAVLKKTNDLRASPIGYNQFANQLGVKQKSFDKSRYTEAMIVLAAYAKSQIGGTLAKSPALGKFIEAHQRKVNKFVDAFDFYAQKKSDDLFALITGKNVTDLEDLPGKLKPLIKVQEQIAALAQPEVIAKVSKMVEHKVERIMIETDEFEPRPVDLDFAEADIEEEDVTSDLLVTFLRDTRVAKLFGRTPPAEAAKDPKDD